MAGRITSQTKLYLNSMEIGKGSRMSQKEKSPSEGLSFPTGMRPTTQSGPSKSFEVPERPLNPPEDTAVQCVECDGEGCEFCDGGWISEEILEAHHEPDRHERETYFDGQ